MAFHKVPRFKQSRRLGLNVSGHPKAMNRAGKGTSRADRKLSEYGRQLLEKQRLRAYYNVSEKQFVKYFLMAKKAEGQTGHNLVQILERRLDNLTYRMGFAASIRQARQMVVHGHILVDGKKVDRPSYICDVGTEISLRPKSKDTEMFKDNYLNSMLNVFPYIEKDEDFTARLRQMPRREEVPIEIEDQLVVEYYSKVL